MSNIFRLLQGLWAMGVSVGTTSTSSGQRTAPKATSAFIIAQVSSFSNIRRTSLLVQSLIYAPSRTSHPPVISVGCASDSFSSVSQTS
jgi:hypothetical protein